MVDLMLAADRLGNPADWLIRAQHNRCLPEGEKLWAHTCEGEPLGEITFMIPRSCKSCSATKFCYTKR